MIEKHITTLKTRVLEYGLLVDTMIQQTFDSVLAKEWNETLEVCNILEPQADDMKLEIAQESMGLIALFHPEAGHLRSIMKMAAIAIDLERMADVVVKIAGISLNNREYFDFTQYPQIMDMVQETRKMLNDVMHAFSEEDALIAVSVISHDDRVDDLCDSLLRKILRKLKTPNEDIDYLMQLLTVIRYVERIADHTTHIAEDVIFIKEGLTLQKVADLQKILSLRYQKDV